MVTSSLLETATVSNKSTHNVFAANDDDDDNNNFNKLQCQWENTNRPLFFTCTISLPCLSFSLFLFIDCMQFDSNLNSLFFTFFLHLTFYGKESVLALLFPVDFNIITQ